MIYPFKDFELYVKEGIVFWRYGKDKRWHTAKGSILVEAIKYLGSKNKSRRKRR